MIMAEQLEGASVIARPPEVISVVNKQLFAGADGLEGHHDDVRVPVGRCHDFDAVYICD